MGILDELRALGLQARATARDLRDFLSAPVPGTGGVPGQGGAHGNLGAKVDKGANWIMRQIKGAGGLANAFGYMAIAEEIFGKPPAHADIGLFFGQEKRNEEAQRATESARRDINRVVAAATFLGPAARGAAAAAALAADFFIGRAERDLDRQNKLSQLQDFVRDNALGDKSKPTFKRVEELIKQHKTPENALETLERAKALREQGMEEIANRDFRHGALHLGMGGVWKDPSRIYSQLETARRAAKIHARTFMMRAGNRDDEDN